jgi:polysaccharide biosynthesis/export protein
MRGNPLFRPLFRGLAGALVALAACLTTSTAAAQARPSAAAPAAQAPAPEAAQASGNYRLAAGDSVRVTVFQNPDMTLDTRVSEDGSINYPLVGKVIVGNLDIPSAERRIAAALKSGGFLKDPQINIQVTDVRGSLVSVLGQVSRAGSFPLLTTNTHASQLLAQAGGVITATGDDKIIVTGTRDGKPFRQVIDLETLYGATGGDADITVMAGDTIYVPRAPSFYVYGEISKPGNYRLERSMTMRQAIAAGGGLTLRGTERRLKVVRKDAQGNDQKVDVTLDESVKPGDVIYVAESIF